MIIKFSRTVVEIELNDYSSVVLLCYYYYYNTIRPQLPQLATSTGFSIRWRTHSLKVSTLLKSSGIHGFVVVVVRLIFHRRKCRHEEESSFLYLYWFQNFHTFMFLVRPWKPEESTYEALKEKLDRQFGVKKLVLAERFCFHSYKQSKTQSLTDYVAELRKLVLTCDWNEAQLADNLRDKFMMGLYNERLLQQLLTHDHKKPLDTPLHSKPLSKNHSNVLKILIIPQQ